MDTSIAAMAQKVLSQTGKPFDFQAFTMRDRLMMPEEDSYASMVAQYIGIPLHEINVEGYFRHVPSEKPQIPLPEPSGSISGSLISITEKSRNSLSIFLSPGRQQDKVDLVN